MGFVVFALMLAATEVWAAISTPGELLMPPWMRIVGPILVAASAYKYPTRDRPAIVVLGGILFLIANRELVGVPVLVHVLVWAGSAFVGLSGIRARNESSVTAKHAFVAILAVIATAFVVLFLPLL